jgi:hypothetical protein
LNTRVYCVVTRTVPLPIAPGKRVTNLAAVVVPLPATTTTEATPVSDALFGVNARAT